MTSYNPTHFCPSWFTCCEENLALRPLPCSETVPLTILTPDDIYDDSTPTTPGGQDEEEQNNPMTCIHCNQGPLTPRVSGIHVIICAICRP